MGHRGIREVSYYNSTVLPDGSRDDIGVRPDREKELREHEGLDRQHLPTLD